MFVNKQCSCDHCKSWREEKGEETDNDNNNHCSDNSDNDDTITHIALTIIDYIPIFEIRTTITITIITTTTYNDQWEHQYNNNMSYTITGSST